MAFKKQFWSDKYEENLIRESQLLSVVRSDFEGEAKRGDTVHVYTYTDNILIGDYTGDDINVQKLEPSQLSLVIDQYKQFAFEVDDVTKLQGDENAMEKFLNNASKKMALEIEKHIYNIMLTEVDPANIIDNSTENITIDNVVQKIESLNIILNNNSVTTDKFVIIDHKTSSLLSQRGLIQTQTVQGTDVFGPVQIKTYGDNIRVISSEIVQGNGTTLDIVMGSFDAVRFVGAMDTIESVRPELRFSDVMKGLYIYGAKVFNGKKLAKLTVKDYA